MGDKEEMDRYEELVTRLDSLQEKLDRVEQLRVSDMAQALTDRYAGKLVQVEQVSNNYISYLVKSPKFHVLQGEISLQPYNYTANDGEGKPVRVPDMTPIYSPIQVSVSDILVVTQSNLEEHIAYAIGKKEDSDKSFKSTLAYIQAYAESEEPKPTPPTEWVTSQEDSDEDTEKAEKGFQEALPSITDPSQTPAVVNNILVKNVEELEIAKKILAKLEEPIDGETNKELEEEGDSHS